MAVIRIKKNYIPVPFENEDGEIEFELRFSMTDESIERLYSQAEEIDKLVDEVEAASEEDDKESAKEVLQKSVDAILGEGSYKILYEHSQSLIITVEYYAEIIYLLVDQLKKSKMKELEKELAAEYFDE